MSNKRNRDKKSGQPERRPCAVDPHPTTCNLCGGQVIYTSNERVYGRKYGSGYCYLCTCCGAYVGTHEPRPREALGLLADSRMRKGKIMCHALFDALWRGKPKARRKRDALYEWLAGQMGLPLADCHFGYFDLQQLRQAYQLLSDVQGLPMRYDNRGRIFFEERRSA